MDPPTVCLMSYSLRGLIVKTRAQEKPPAIAQRAAFRWYCLD
jgi:hypothetical protein